MTGEIYEYIENFAEEMFVLDWCMNGGTDILHFLFNRWQYPIKWNTSLEREVNIVKSNFAFVSFW